ncbi:MAG TPA: GGDEF domain-containing protein [Solirubrobacterales bacterium]|nr:GGDEF domain-containing protein [Solirubrobacterales bacterium]
MARPRPNPPALPPDRTSVGTRVLVAGLVAIAAGLLLPLLIGSFSHTQALVLALVEIGCLVLLAVGVLVMSRRLTASHEALWVLARRDELTGVGNYRALHERLAEEISRHQRHRREFALVLLDLDGFKQINEEHGHLEGDRLLAEIGQALQDEVRREDSVFRQGGDEFAVIVPEAGAEEAEEVAMRLCGRVRYRGFGSDESRPVSAAAGIALFPADGVSGEELLGRADRDLFDAKRGRRAA